MKQRISPKAVREAQLKTVRNQYIQISELQRKVRELEAEVEKLKASKSGEVHNHYHTHYHPSPVPYVQPAWIPTYTFTCDSGATTPDTNQYSLIN
jgi:hypothetical protein